MDFRTSLNLTLNELKEARMENLTAEFAPGNAGRIAYDVTGKSFILDDGSAVRKVLLDFVRWDDVVGKPTSFPASSHTHQISGVVGLRAEIDAKSNVDSPAFTGSPTAPTPGGSSNDTRVATTGFVQSLLSNYGAGDMLKSSYDSNDDGKVDAADVADSVAWSGITGRPSTFPSTAHSHPLDEITGLQAALNGKADSTHSHVASDISDLATAVNGIVTSYFDSAAGARNNLDELVELIDQIEANASSLAQLPRRFESNVGDGTAATFDLAHNFNTRDVIVEVYRNSGSFDTVLADVARPSVNVVSVTISPAPAVDEFRVVIRH